MTTIIQGRGRSLNPRDPDTHPEDWSYFWFCRECGVESRHTNRERATAWSANHRCAGWVPS